MKNYKENKGSDTGGATNGAPLSQLEDRKVELETFDMTYVQHVFGCLADEYAVQTERETGFGAWGVGVLHVNNDEFQLQTRGGRTILSGKVKAIEVIRDRSGKVLYKGSLEEPKALSPEEVWGE